MKIAVLGVQELTAGAGIIERHCRGLYPRLVDRGHQVTVFVRDRRRLRPDRLDGVELRTAPAAAARGIGSLLHSASGSVAAMRDGFDMVHYHAAGPSLFSFMPRLRNQAIVATVHGLDWQHAAGGKGGRAMLKAGEWAAARFPRRTIVVSERLQAYFRQKYGREADHIPDGVDRAVRPRSIKMVKDLGIEPRRYILFLGNLVPEKGCLDLITAFQESGLTRQLVIAGPGGAGARLAARPAAGAPAGGGTGRVDHAYAARVSRQAATGGNIVLAGRVEGELLDQLSAHAALFVLPSIMEDTPVSLLEALALGVPVLGADIGPVRGVLEDGKFGALYRAGDVTDLKLRLAQALDDLPALRKKAEAGRRRVRVERGWDRIAGLTEEVFQEALRFF